MRHFADWWLMLALVTPCMLLTPALAADQPGRVTVLRDSPLPTRAVVQIGTDKFRSHNHIKQVAFAPDGKWIAAAEAVGGIPTVVLFGVTTGELTKRLDIPDARQHSTSSIAFSPDGRRLLWGETQGHLAMWDLVEDRLIFREKLHGAEITGVVFSPDGKLVGACSVDGVVGLRRADDLAEPVRVITLEDANHIGAGDRFMKVAGYCLAFTPAGDQLVIGGKKNAQISVWSVANGDFHRVVEFAHGDGRARNDSVLNHIAMVPNRGQVMSAGHKTIPKGETKWELGPVEVPISQIRFWDLNTGKRSAIELGGEDFGYGYAAISPDGKQVAVADVGQLALWDASSGEPISSVLVPAWRGNQPVYSPDGTIVAVAIDNAVAIFDSATGRRLHYGTQTPLGALRLCSWAPEGGRIVTVHTDDGICRVWQAETGKLIWSHDLAPALVPGEVNSYPAMAAFSPDGQSVIIAGGKNDRKGSLDSAIVVCDSATGTVRRERELETIVSLAELDQDGSSVVVFEPRGRRGEQSRLHAFDLATGRMRLVFPKEEPASGLGAIAAMATRPDSPIILVWQLPRATCSSSMQRAVARPTRSLRTIGLPSRGGPASREASCSRCSRRPSVATAVLSRDQHRRPTVCLGRRHWRSGVSGATSLRTRLLRLSCA
jgi:WD40 repeat protein